MSQQEILELRCPRCGNELELDDSCSMFGCPGLWTVERYEARNGPGSALKLNRDAEP